MRIHDLCCTTADTRTRATARVTWEDSDRPQRQIYVETEARFAKEVSCNPDAFLLAAILPAMHHGERRVQVEGKVCPQLRNGLMTAMQLLRHWYGPARHGQVQIETTKGFEPPFPRHPARTASFMSGGVDALATLRSNRLDFPMEHPGSIRDGFLVHGVDLGGYEKFEKKRANFELARASLSAFAQTEDLTLIPVYMNLRWLDEGDQLFALESHGAVLAAIAQAFSRRITTALIASTSHISELIPWGSHPLLDPNYSTADLSIRHDGAQLTRLEKVRLLSEWDAALQTLRSCYHPFRPDHVLNCGQCEKCIRTMTELLICGALHRCRTFPFEDVSRDLLQTLEALPRAEAIPDPEHPENFVPRQLNYVNIAHWRQLIEPLRKIERADLAEVIEVKLAEYKRHQACLNASRAKQRSWLRLKHAATQLDATCLGGTLFNLKERFLRNRLALR